jgi:hypothetical protein
MLLRFVGLFSTPTNSFTFPKCRSRLWVGSLQRDLRVEAKTPKRFSLIDAMVLVAATGIGLARGRSVAGSGLTLQIIVEYVVSMATMWTLAILALNLTRYATTRRELACRPGFSALVAVVVVRAIEIIQLVIDESRIDERFLFRGVTTWIDRIWALLNVDMALYQCSIAGAVAAVWLTTAMAGCWRPEKTWIDRVGRCLGVFWLLAAVAYSLSDWACRANSPSPPSLQVPRLPPDPLPIDPLP